MICSLGNFYNYFFLEYRIQLLLLFCLLIFYSCLVSLFSYLLSICFNLNHNTSQKSSNFEINLTCLLCADLNRKIEEKFLILTLAPMPFYVSLFIFAIDLKSKIRKEKITSNSKCHMNRTEKMAMKNKIQKAIIWLWLYNHFL